MPVLGAVLGQHAKDENQHVVPLAVAVAVTVGSRSGFSHISKTVSELVFGSHLLQVH